MDAATCYTGSSNLLTRHRPEPFSRHVSLGGCCLFEQLAQAPNMAVKRPYWLSLYCYHAPDMAIVSYTSNYLSNISPNDAGNYLGPCIRAIRFPSGSWGCFTRVS